MSLNRKYENKVCVVTGAGSGIGRELALCLAEHGAKLALSDIDEASLLQTTNDVKALGAETHAQLLDVSERKVFYDYAQIIEDHFGAVHQLYNNAGISGGGRSIADTPDDLIDRIIDINLNGVLHGSRAFLRRLVASGDGVLVNISSLNGLVAQPNVAIYCLTKFAVRGLTEAMRCDALLYDEKIQIVSVHPGGVKTNIASSRGRDMSHLSEEERAQAEKLIAVYQEKFLTYPARDAAMDILRGVAKGRSRIVVTPQAKHLDRLSRLLPQSYPKLITQATKRIMNSINKS